MKIQIELEPWGRRVVRPNGVDEPLERSVTCDEHGNVKLQEGTNLVHLSWEELAQVNKLVHDVRQ